MPDTVVHNSMGKEVYDHLRNEISSQLIYDIFRFGVMAPDIYYYYRYFALPLRHGINWRSSVLHSMRTGDLLIAMAKKSESKEFFSFLSGILCHYALDGSIHPYVHELVQNCGWTHAEIEKKLDQMELLKQGKRISDRPVSRELLPPYLPDNLKADVNAVYKEVYGWNDTWELLRTSYRHMKQFTWIIEDPSGILCALTNKGLLKKLYPKCSGLSYRREYPDTIDFSWFPKAEEKAVKEAVTYIDSCYEFVNGRLEEDELRRIIGNRSYATGEEIIETFKS